jgi:hypothetical protein
VKDLALSECKSQSSGPNLSTCRSHDLQHNNAVEKLRDKHSNLAINNNNNGMILYYMNEGGLWGCLHGKLNVGVGRYLHYWTAVQKFLFYLKVCSTI